MSNSTPSSTTPAPREAANGTPPSAFAAKMARFTAPPVTTRTAAAATPPEQSVPAEEGGTTADAPTADVPNKDLLTTDAPTADATPTAARPAADRPRREGRDGASNRGATTTRHFRIDPGVANVTVTSRVPKNLHAKLKIHVLTQQLATAGSDACMNAFIIDAIAEKLARDEAA